MFRAKTERIQDISLKKKDVISDLKKLLDGKSSVYIDYANIRPWANKLKWHFDIKRLKQFLDSFDTIDDIKFYQGILGGDKKSEDEAELIKKIGYTFITKPVKIMKIRIDVSRISKDSTSVLKNFIRQAFLRKLDIETIEFLNSKIEKFNDAGDLFIEDRKCNFDVELGIDMLLDSEKNNIDTFILMSGDSDFVDPVNRLLLQGKKVVLFATAGVVSSELAQLRKFDNFIIFDIKKIAKFICWKKEINNVN